MLPIQAYQTDLFLMISSRWGSVVVLVMKQWGLAAMRQQPL